MGNYGAIGSIDLGGAINPMSGIPNGITVFADGNLPTGVNSFFNTGLTGDGAFGFTLPNLAPGVLSAFQCGIYTTGANGSQIALSNAVQVAIQ